ncbi:N-acetylmannosamine-6-phosphate 2-epimerase [Cryobacterium sp. N19]|uniref:N-acetylmannosamine-6-phosphate 2-epimerase n=1 Tax=Cryobacterium sp. N19 TaxID=2048288 RepID=UPI0018EB5EFE|nr:N-acetylmannosamine-6-phosphate 2-epimerase [Cryobacterium sp. N19]
MNLSATLIMSALDGGLIVSCQAYPGEPMRDPRTMAQVARAAVLGGAVAVRLQGVADIRAAADLSVPIIGLWKDGEDDVVITPTLEHARAVADAGADIVALDGTRRHRPDGLTLAETIAGLRQTHSVLVMADCGSLDDAIAAEAAGADILGTTLSGYSGERPTTSGPDVELIGQIAAHCSTPIVAEGRIHTPEDAAAARRAGAHAVCVGTAITHPTTITSWFIAAIDKER